MFVFPAVRTIRGLTNRLADRLKDRGAIGATTNVAGQSQFGGEGIAHE